MKQKNNKGSKCYFRVAFGNTIKVPLSHRQSKSHSRSKKPPPALVAQKQAAECNMLGNTFKKGQIHALSIKQQFDQRIKNLFLLIDFDCSGFISHTKISFCKQIPEKMFYFLGGVFQKIKQLGAVSQKIFMKMCEEVYLQANLIDIQNLLLSEHQTNKSQVRLNQSKFSIKVKPNESHLKEESWKQDKQNDFQTKKQENSHKPLYSLKLKTENFEDKESLSNSWKRLKVSALHKDPYQHYQETLQTGLSSVNFQSNKVRALTQRLDRQLERNNFLTFERRLG